MGELSLRSRGRKENAKANRSSGDYPGASCPTLCPSRVYHYVYHINNSNCHHPSSLSVLAELKVDFPRAAIAQKNVSNLELRKIRITLTVLSSIPELYASLHSSHKFYEDWPLTLAFPDEGSC